MDVTLLKADKILPGILKHAAGVELREVAQVWPFSQKSDAIWLNPA